MALQIKRLPAVNTYRESPRPVESFARMRKSRVPEGGWTQRHFQSDEGKKLIRDVLAIRRLAIRENAGRLTKSLSAMFDSEAEQVLIHYVNGLRKRTGKTIGSSLINLVLNLQVPAGTEDLWEAALNSVFNETSVRGRILRVFRPVYQSVLSHIVKKTNVVLHHKVEQPEEVAEPVEEGPILPVTSITIRPNPALPPAQRPTRSEQEKAITRKADNLCRKVTRISDTTRRRMKKFFAENIEAGTTVGEMIQKMKKEFPKVTKNRVQTIVRNELAMAANEAQIMSFKDTKTLTHCSVIGCQAVEENSPEYKGFHTCNIRNVPVEDLELVEFHINHTGSWVPSGFRNADGSVPKLRLGNSPGIGAYDDPNALRHRLAKPRK